MGSEDAAEARIVLDVDRTGIDHLGILLPSNGWQQGHQSASRMSRIALRDARAAGQKNSGQGMP